MDWSRTLQALAFLVLLLAIALFVVQAFPGFVGADHAFTVESGSMEPTIGTGAVVFVTEESVGSVEVGDIITYRDDGRNLVTHRVVEVHQAESSLRFVTKGDANEDRDPEPVYRGDYVGTVDYSVPYIGYVTAFGRSFWGYVALVLVPAMALIISELWSLYRHMKPGDSQA